MTCKLKGENDCQCIGIELGRSKCMCELGPRLCNTLTGVDGHLRLKQTWLSGLRLSGYQHPIRTIKIQVVSMQRGAREPGSTILLAFAPPLVQVIAASLAKVAVHDVCVPKDRVPDFVEPLTVNTDYPSKLGVQQIAA